MPSLFRSGNLRLRLTLWYGSAFSILLLLHIGVATYVHYRQLTNQTYHAEIQDLETTEGLVYQTSDGSIAMNEDYFNNPQVRMRLDRHLEILAPDGRILFQDTRLHGALIDDALADSGVSAADVGVIHVGEAFGAAFVGQSHQGAMPATALWKPRRIRYRNPSTSSGGMSRWSRIALKASTDME